MYEFTDNDKIIYENNKYLIIDNFLDKEIANNCQKEIIEANNRN